MTDLLATGPDDGPILILAHGAGAGMETPFMTAIATLDTKTSSFFDHRDPNMVKILSTAKRNT